MPNTILKLENIHKSFDSTEVLKGISLDIASGEFITLLGPSGCGKTTTIRIIAGLEEPDSGKVILEGKDMTFEEPNKRSVNTVFQNYALFPHMTVAENIGYSQKLKGVGKKEIARMVKEALELVQLEGYEKRMPNQLSGGQSQRVAIARAVINQPKVLLLDEPLGALDLQLRQQMQVELKYLQKKLGITFIYITHDQEEALNMSDRIVVMREGEFEQIGSPVEIYNNPVSRYVAEFVGSANILEGKVVKAEPDMVTFESENGTGSVVPRNGKIPKVGDNLKVAIRGEHISVEEEHTEGHCCLRSTVKEKNFAGGSLHIVLNLKNGKKITSYHHGINCPVKVGDTVCASWDPAEAVMVDLGRE